MRCEELYLSIAGRKETQVDKLKAIWAKFRVLPRLVKDGSFLLAGGLLGRLGAPWIF